MKTILGSGRRARAGVALAAGVAALAVTGLVSSASATATADSTTVTAPSAAPRLAVPWKQVGSGWLLATWARTIGAKEVLYLLAPGGKRYAVAHLSKDVEVQAWSPDKRHALLTGDRGTTQIDLTTGRSTRMPSLDDADVIGYTRPSGSAILATGYVDHGTYLTPQVIRVGNKGPVLHRYPTSVKGAGNLSAGTVTGTADGTQMVFGAQHGLVLMRVNGTVVRRLIPGVRGCNPTGTSWARDVALASCNGALWAVPLSGAEAQRLTLAKSADSPFGNAQIWRYSQGRLGLAEVGCGPEKLVRFDAAGRSTPLDVPSPTGHAGTVVYHGHQGDVLFLTLSNSGCMSSSAVLFAYDVRHGTSRMLLGAPQTAGTVLGVVPFATTH